MKKIVVYDATLRDGVQAEGISFSLQDKLDIARELDALGVDYIEGGYPLSNPKDEAFYREIRKRPLARARISAFGSTRRPHSRVAQDAGIKALLASKAPAVTIVGKSWDFHVVRALRVSLEENLAMIRDSVKYLKRQKREVLFDAEHFFDGYKANPEYAMKTVLAAEEAGADWIVLCDTNGGCLPAEVGRIVNDVSSKIETPLGIHCHNDSGTAVGNTLEAVRRGAVHVQGTINGLGERCGNADLTVVIPDLILKMKRSAIDRKNLKKLTEVSRFVYESANMMLVNNQPFVGRSAFAHKGGLHVSAVLRDERTYEHVNPALVGNTRRLLVGELSGRATVAAKASKLDLSENRPLLRRVLKQVQELENEGYQFEAAEASFELLLRKAAGLH
ncbi:MAG: citramalate synthase, partial [Phycisphaerae bacterium]|nr:citramalate synthase [Phycisphaerae bacterium]